MRRIRHLKRGSTYDVVGDAEVQISCNEYAAETRVGKNGRILTEGDLLRVYRGDDGKLWVRFPDEFEGRFEDAS